MKRFCSRLLSIINYLSAINGMIQDPLRVKNAANYWSVARKKYEINKDFRGLPPLFN